MDNVTTGLDTKPTTRSQLPVPILLLLFLLYQLSNIFFGQNLIYKSFNCQTIISSSFINISLGSLDLKLRLWPYDLYNYEPKALYGNWETYRNEMLRTPLLLPTYALNTM